MTTPSNLRSVRSIPVMTAVDSEAGYFGSSFESKTCATRTASGPPVAMIDRNGSSSFAVHVFVTSTQPRCVSAVELPWPGKCLSVPPTPASWSPARYARPCAVTTVGSAEKLRSRAPMIGLFGFTFTSTTGREVQVDAESRQRLADRLGPFPRVVRVIPGAERGLRDGCREAISSLEPVDLAALLVDGDKERDRGRGAKAGHEGLDLRGRGDVSVIRAGRRVVVEEKDAAEPHVADVGDCLRGVLDREPTEADKEHLGDLRAEIGLGVELGDGGTDGPGVGLATMLGVGEADEGVPDGVADAGPDVAVGTDDGSASAHAARITASAPAPTPRRNVRRERFARSGERSVTRSSSPTPRIRA